MHKKYAYIKEKAMKRFPNMFFMQEMFMYEYVLCIYIKLLLHALKGKAISKFI